jgi:hypothetical protein
MLRPPAMCGVHDRRYQCPKPVSGKLPASGVCGEWARGSFCQSFAFAVRGKQRQDQTEPKGQTATLVLHVPSSAAVSRIVLKLP